MRDPSTNRFQIGFIPRIKDRFAFCEHVLQFRADIFDYHTISESSLFPEAFFSTILGCTNPNSKRKFFLVDKENLNQFAHSGFIPPQGTLWPVVVISTESQPMDDGKSIERTVNQQERSFYSIPLILRAIEAIRHGQFRKVFPVFSVN
jgi:hypothetical protein